MCEKNIVRLFRYPKGRTIRNSYGKKGGGRGGGRSTKKLFAQGKIKLKKNYARQLILKNIHALA